MEDPERPWDRDLTDEELEEAARDWPDSSPARQRHYMKLRLRARWLHEQEADPATGRRRFGGPQPGSGRKPKVPLGEYLVDQATEAQKKIWDAFEAGLDAKDDPGLRVKTAATVTKLVQGEETIAIRRQEIQRELDKTPLDEVKRIFAEKFAEAIERGDIDPATVASMFGTGPKAIEGTAVEVS